VQEAARGSVRIDAHAPPTTRPGHRSSGFADDAICNLAVSGSGQIQTARASTWMRHRVALRNSNRPGFGISFRRQADRWTRACATLVQRTEPIGQGIGLAGRFSGQLACARSPLKPPSPGVRPCFSRRSI
jgi:hypothetical protein